MPPRVVDPLAREAARRRAVDVLRSRRRSPGYGAAAVGNGLGAEEARRAVGRGRGRAGASPATLRRLARIDRLDPAGRRALAVDLAASGLSQRAIAARLGVSKRMVLDDLRRAGWVYPGSPRYERGSRRPAQVGREEPLALGGGLGGGDPPGGLLVADRGEGVVEGVLLVGERGEIAFGVANGMIVS